MCEDFLEGLLNQCDVY